MNRNNKGPLMTLQVCLPLPMQVVPSMKARQA